MSTGNQSQQRSQQLAERPGNGAHSTELVDLRGQPNAIQQIANAQVDRSIATAKSYPRSMTTFLSKARSLIALDPKLAAECTYKLPKRKSRDDDDAGRRNQSKPQNADDDDEDDGRIKGPSVRLAEIIASCWGNLSIDSHFASDDGKRVVVYAEAWDLEENHRRASEVHRRVTDRNGRRYSDDMVAVTIAAALSIAERNATFKVIPRSIVNMLEAEAKAVARGDVKTLPERTKRAVEWFVRKGITAPRVYETLGIAGPADMSLDLLEDLNGYRTAIMEGRTTVEQVFAPPEPPAEKQAAAGEASGGTRAQQAADRIRGGNGGAAAKTAPQAQATTPGGSEAAPASEEAARAETKESLRKEFTLGEQKPAAEEAKGTPAPETKRGREPGEEG